MHRPFSRSWLVMVSLLVSCSTSSSNPQQDAGSADRAQSCYWQLPGGQWVLPHFRFLLTTPDGQAQSPPGPYYPLPNSSAPRPINDFEGQVVGQSGNQLTVDSCNPTLPCQPSLYRFTVCSGYGTCEAGGPGALSIPIPVGRRVRVVWHLDNDVPGFCPGLYYLAIYDAEPGPGQGNLFFVGSGGRPNSTTNSVNPNPMKDLPFSVATLHLWCGITPSDALGSGWWDDFAFVFTPRSGTGAPLRLATGESGTLDVAAPAGGVQRLQFHCIDAVQPDYTDDYWNWDFWASGDIPSSSLDAGVSPPDGASGGDRSAPPDSASDIADSAGRTQSCYWQLPGGQWALPHFRFLLTTPDGQAQSPPRSSNLLQDGSARWPVNDFEGQVVGQSGNQLIVDSCNPTLPCLPSPYSFTVCSGYGTCEATGPGAAISIPLPVGRRVRVVWHLDNEVPAFSPGLFYLAIYDAEPGPGQGNLFFVGSGGRPNSTTSNYAPNNPLKELPFSASTERLWCGTAPTDAPAYPWDDYAFVFAPKGGTGAPLRLATGESGTLDVATPAGGVQRLQFHCIDAVQPGYTDDYWNWDFWASGEIPPSAADAGGGG